MPPDAINISEPHTVAAIYCCGIAMIAAVIQLAINLAQPPSRPPKLPPGEYPLFPPL